MFICECWKGDGCGRPQGGRWFPRPVGAGVGGGGEN